MQAERKTNRYLLKVSNNDNPFPEDKGLENPQTLGLRLVTTLVTQLGGTVDLQKKPMTLFSISFPVENGDRN